jgi:hypothetical protein
LYCKILVIAGAVSLLAGAAHADAIMPDFTGAPAGWTTDRYDPHSFGDLGTQFGRDHVLGIGITNAEGSAGRASTGQQGTFYNTQGRQHAATGGAGSVLSADIYVPDAWRDASSGARRTDMWGVMTDSSSAVSAYTIIGFTNVGGAHFRIWDEDLAAGWFDVATPVAFDDWTTLSIDFDGTSFLYSIDGALIYTDSSIHGSTGFSAAIMEAYNFNDPALGTGYVANDYTAYWDNAVAAAAVPEPGTLTLIGAGLAGIGVMRRRRKAAV